MDIFCLCCCCCVFSQMSQNAALLAPQPPIYVVAVKGAQPARYHFLLTLILPEANEITSPPHRGGGVICHCPDDFYIMNRIKRTPQFRPNM
mgnify:CR=1 FL=1